MCAGWCVHFKSSRKWHSNERFDLIFQLWSGIRDKSAREMSIDATRHMSMAADSREKVNSPPGYEYTGWPEKNGTVDTVVFSGLCSNQQLSFFTLQDRASFSHYNNTKIIKFGWELFILWVISYGLSCSGFARFPEFRGTINDKLMANLENDSP